MARRFLEEMAKDAESRAKRFEAQGKWREALRWLGFAADAYGDAGQQVRAAECWAAAQACCEALRLAAVKRLDAVG